MESNELIDREIQQLMKPPTTYWARIRESVSEYGLHVKVCVDIAAFVRMHRCSVQYEFSNVS
jgi:hypothetical protein